MSGLLERLGRRAVRHRWWFLSVWVVMAVAVVALAGVLDGQFSDNFRIPDTQSQQALDLLERDFPSRAGDNALVVFQSDAGITSSSVEPAISESVAALEKIPNVTTVTDPYGPFGSAFISKNGQIAVVTVQFDTQAQNRLIKVWIYNSQNATPDVQRVNQLARAAHIPITTITETLSPASATFEQWQVAELRSLRAALHQATGK